MLQEPVAEEKLSPNRSMITNQQITKYNKVAASVIDESAAELWTSNVMIAKSYLKDSQGNESPAVLGVCACKCVCFGL